MNARAEFRPMLLALRGERATEQERLAESLDEVLTARADGTADDEHDPDGPTLSAEWSRIAGLGRDFAARSGEVERALERIDAGTYGVCLRCGLQIAVDRLRVRPAAELCIECARLHDAPR